MTEPRPTIDELNRLHAMTSEEFLAYASTFEGRVALRKTLADAAGFLLALTSREAAADGVLSAMDSLANKLREVSDALDEQLGIDRDPY